MTKVLFMGTPHFSVPVLQMLINEGYEVVGVVTQPDRIKGRKKVLTPPPVKVEALKHQIPVYQPEKVRNKKDLDELLRIEPDIIITAAFGQILPNDLLDAPKYGCINVHASLLPELRGGAPIHYSIIQGKSKTGISIMYMVEKLDAGDILSQVEVAIEETDTVGTLHDKLSVAGASLLQETLPKLLEGKITPIPQDDSQATFARNIKREDEKINWNKKGSDIYNHIRGLNPWPVAYTTLNGQPLKIWWGDKVKNAEKKDPGTVVKVDQEGFVVATGDETGILVKKLQPAGKKKMNVTDFLRGTNLKAGMKLGEGNEE
ncbi:methionyl-tRNA formyltransferase [Bacillus carboniphilus]|uniref:Methionyl-tRNA formyltransferase n=1 Tax=Bacillus carboniphilus TaxID=86663 RepID=A0ABY9JVZ9_9BACI|nr:methionyl-tRNA formyltransferase [Bacillus carboniphilus]WLR43579.1 methionyl-tRNA formyltransferase [Bacillus carboniphilus]